MEAKLTIEAAAAILGGPEALAKWANTNNETRTIFWRDIHPKLLPLHVHGTGTNGALVLQIAREQLEHKMAEQGLPRLTFDDVPTLELKAEKSANVKANGK